MKQVYLLTVVATLLFGCSESKFDTIVDEVLSNKLLSANADSGLVIVMDLQDGSVISKIGKEKDSDKHWYPSKQGSPLAIMRPITYLCLLENGALPKDTFNTYDGLYVTSQGDSIIDHNYKQGGYGTLSLKYGFIINSDIVLARSIEKCLPQGYAAISSFIKSMGIQHTGKIYDYQSLQDAKATPQNMLGWINNVAKSKVNGAGDESISELQDALLMHVEEGLGKGAKSEKVKISGTSFFAKTEAGNVYHMSFVGYFPSGNPQYSIYVELCKSELPASSKYAAEVAKIVAEKIIEMSNK